MKKQFALDKGGDYIVIDYSEGRPEIALQKFIEHLTLYVVDMPMSA